MMAIEEALYRAVGWAYFLLDSLGERGIDS
jgi:hypothetical protein